MQTHTSEGNHTSAASEDIDDLLASFSPKTTSGTEGYNEQRKAPRFRVRWNAEVIVDGQISYRGFINDISSVGGSVCLKTSLRANKCTLRIHVPPLNVESKPHVIEAAGRIIYVVYDGTQQLFRAAINFLGFNPESDVAFLEERLTKYQLKIPEF